MTDTILVTAATGTVGKEVVNQLKLAGAPMRVGVRDRSKGQALGFGGLNLVDFDFRKPYTFANALDGVNMLFVLMPPGVPGIYRNVQRFITAAVQAQVKYVVYMSGMGVDRRPAEPMRHIERHIEATSGLHYTFLRPNWFMQNYNSWLAGMIENGEIRLPLEDGRISLVDTRDIAAVATRLLTDATLRDTHMDTAHILTGPTALDHKTIAATLSKALGKDIRYISTPVEANLQELRADGLSDEEIDTMRWLYADIHSGYTATMTTAVEDITGQAPRTFAAYVEEIAHQRT